MDEKTFLNTRSRFQRISDARFFAGWVRELNASSIILTIAEPGDMQPGDEFMFQLNGRDSGALFPATLAMSSGEDYLFNIPEPLRLTTPCEEARVYVQDVSGILHGDSRELDVIILDVSRKGAGVLTPLPVSAGERVVLTIDTPGGSVNCAGEVRYCRNDAKVKGHFRAGIMLDDMGRIERARWARLIGGSNAA